MTRAPLPLSIRYSSARGRPRSLPQRFVGAASPRRCPGPSGHLAENLAYNCPVIGQDPASCGQLNYRMGMNDREVVAAIAAGDPAGIAAAYDAYAADLYGYCHWLLGEPAGAAEAVQDTFVSAAATPGDLPEATELRPWLYAVARDECLRRLRARREACPALNTLLADWDGQPTEEAHELVGAHIAQCELCAARRPGEMRPAVLSGLPPPAALPAELREQVLRLCSDASPDASTHRRRVAWRAESRRLARFWQVTRLRSRDSIPSIHRPTTATLVLTAWVVAVWVVVVTLLMFTGSRPSHALAARPSASTPRSSPAAATTTATVPTTIPTTASAKPSPAVSQTQAAALPPGAPSASYTESAKPSRSLSPSPTKSRSPKPSESPSPSSSPSGSPSPSPSPTA
jgi:DNA-directed RNA polymerase specialized sigma24 family protein